MKCRACNGAGAAVSKPQQLKGEQCNKCYGRGRVSCISYLCRGTGHYMGPYGVVVCAMCSGSGRMTCDECRGAGRH